jgi:hypothetical protein
MSISKKWMTPQNIGKVLERYRSSDAPTALTLSREMKTTIHNVCKVLETHMEPAEYEALKKLRYSRSKLGNNNHWFGKTGPQHHCWKGIVEDGYGYLTCLVEGKRVFVHRYVMAQALGVKDIPRNLEVHHINEDTRDNRLDNLALVTSAGHKSLHLLQRMEAKSLKLRKQSLWEAFQYTTSR